MNDTMNLFAEAHHVRSKRDTCGDNIIPGRSGHVYEHGADKFGVYLSFGSVRQWTAAKRKLTTMGFTVRQDADMEGTALFRPDNEQQARLALRIARVRSLPVLSPEQRQRLAERMGRPITSPDTQQTRGVQAQNSHAQDADRAEIAEITEIAEIPASEVSEQVSEQAPSPAVVELPAVEKPKRIGGRPRKWRSDAERMATVREQQKPLILPALPEGVYRARKVATARSSSPSSTARRNYLAGVQGNRCFYCERVFGTYVRKNAAKPEPLRMEDEHFIPRRLPGARKDSNRHAVCHICNRLKSDLVFSSEDQCRAWLVGAWQLNGYQEVEVHAIHYLGQDRSVIFEERLAA